MIKYIINIPLIGERTHKQALAQTQSCQEQIRYADKTSRQRYCKEMAWDLAVLLSFHRVKYGNSFCSVWKNRLPGEGSERGTGGSWKKRENSGTWGSRGGSAALRTSHHRQQSKLAWQSRTWGEQGAGMPSEIQLSCPQIAAGGRQGGTGTGLPPTGMRHCSQK